MESEQVAMEFLEKGAAENLVGLANSRGGC